MSSDPKLTRTRREVMRDWAIYALRLAALLATVYILLGVLFCFGYTKGRSMEPTLHNGDIVFGVRTKVLDVAIEHGDIVMAWDRNREKPIILVKRVIGLPGDVIEIDKNTHVVYCNGERLDEPYLTVETYPGDMDGPVTVKEGHLIIMGDNRMNSNDSRYASVGQIPMEDVVGKMLVKLVNIGLN